MSDLYTPEELEEAERWMDEMIEEEIHTGHEDREGGTGASYD